MSVMSHQLVRRLVPQVLAIFFIILISAVSQAAQVTLAWDPNVVAPDGYHVFLHAEGETYDYASPAWPQAGDNPQATTCTIANLADDTQYYFVVRAYTGNDVSGDSNEVAYHTQAPTPADNSLQLALAWDLNDPAPDGYRVFQHMEGEAYDYASPVWPQAGDNPQATSCTIGNLTADTQYYFIVRAYTGGDVSGASNEVAYHTEAQTPVSYTLSVATGAHGSISPGTVTVDAGGSQTFTISPEPYYHIVDVLVDGQSIGPTASYTFSQVDANHTIGAAFAIDTFTISAAAGAHGSVSPGMVTVSAGGSQTFTIAPNSNYHVADVLVDGRSVGAVSSYSFNQVMADHVISATFAIDTFTISGVAGEHGGISPATATVDAGGSQTFTIAPNSNYHVADVLVDGRSVGAVQSYTFESVVASHAIEASFEADLFTISAAAGTGGTISPSGQIQLAGGADQSFILTADEGYEIQNLVVDGVYTEAQDSYIFSNISENHSIMATFVLSNQPPVADAGPDQVADEAQVVTLSGLNSHDPDDGIVQFQWRQIQGDPVALSSPDQETTTFMTPDVDMAGQSLVFELTVTDAAGKTAMDTCIVNVTWVNEAPIAGAGADQSVSEGSLVTLNASASTDADDGIGSYSWLQVQGPPVILSDPQSPTPYFTAPDVGSEGASLIFELTVTDTNGLQDTDACTVTVTWNNIEPTADAGPDQTVTAGDEVTLDGSRSADPDGANLVYQWRQTDGPPVNLSDATAVSPVFTVPLEGFGDTLLAFQLTVTDEGGLQGADTCQVAVQATNQDEDTEPPVLTITKPVKDYITVKPGRRRFSIRGSATDNTSVDRVVWVSDRGLSGTASGTESWLVSMVHLYPGINTFTITAYDSAGNSQSKTITIKRKQP